MSIENESPDIELPYSRGEFLNENEYLRYKEGFEDAKRLILEHCSYRILDKSISNKGK